MSSGDPTVFQRLSHAALVLLIALMFAGLVSAVLALPPGVAGLSGEVNAELAGTGMRNPVTATLLDFRSYDTLLEIAVLLLAVMAIRTLRRGDVSTRPPDGEILMFLCRILVPVMILIAGYLLMVGFDASGGAFQAGAILAAAGVLLHLSGRSLPLRDGGLPMRFALVVGLAAFVAMGVAGMLVANAFLDYPQGKTTDIALILEVVASVSIAFALVETFVGVLRGSNAGRRMRETEPDER